VVTYLASIPQDQIDVQFDPFSVKDKWTRFFRAGLQRPQVDTERALKNEDSAPLGAFIADKMDTFSDKQLIKACHSTRNSNRHGFITER